MYIPPLYREDDLATLHTLMQQYNFATMVTQQAGAPFATHLPLTLETQAGPYGTLYGHVSRANAQWRDFETAAETLVIFQGPHSYVSPSWYEVELSVPTWNYAAVHAYGTPQLITDHETCYNVLDKLVRLHEAPFARPWQFQLPDDYVQKMMRGIVVFGMRITRLEGKFKLSQNRSQTDQEQVALMLQQSADPLSRDVGELMQQRQARAVVP